MKNSLIHISEEVSKTAGYDLPLSDAVERGTPEVSRMPGVFR